LRQPQNCSVTGFMAASSALLAGVAMSTKARRWRNADQARSCPTEM
jgi:hypothetical protein